MQKLEIIEQQLEGSKRVLDDVASISARVEQIAEATDLRLMLSGLGSLLHHNNVTAEDHAKYNGGWEVSLRRKE